MRNLTCNNRGENKPKMRGKLYSDKNSLGCTGQNDYVDRGASFYVDAGVITAEYSKISFATMYKLRTMIKRERNRKFKREYAGCQFVDCGK